MPNLRKMKISFPDSFRSTREKTVKFLVTFFTVGTAGTLLPPTHELFLMLFPLALLISFTVILTFSEPVKSKKTWFVIILIATAGFLIEAFGVNTGKIFGQYSYGKTLGPGIYGTPFIIGINWAMLLIASSSLSSKLRIPAILQVAAASLIMVIYDLFLEQVAGELDMWCWENNSVPLMNYVAWFFVAFLLNSLLKLSRIRTDFHVSLAVIICQTSFFAVIILFFQFR